MIAQRSLFLSLKYSFGIKSSIFSVFLSIIFKIIGNNVCDNGIFLLSFVYQESDTSLLHTFYEKKP
jgi:hypothetical protein